ncbi:MAG: hypothetical protein INH41_09375 [Myxococcaceae bacterium]|jgi:hypothetical protein|nr:hypothetical protein [Myxococcaceae bacterium]
MAQGWSFSGRRVEFRVALPAGKLVVVAPPSKAPMYELQRSQVGEGGGPLRGRCGWCARAGHARR